jgi:hypothetical protein
VRSGSCPSAVDSVRAISAPFGLTGYAHLDSRAESQRRIDCFGASPGGSHALFELQRNRFRYQLRVQLRLMRLQNVDEDLTIGLRQTLFSFSISAPLRPMKFRRDVEMVMRSCCRIFDPIELIPAAFTVAQRSLTLSLRAAAWHKPV